MDGVDLGTVLAVIGGLAAAIATIYTAAKKVPEGNYATMARRLRRVEQEMRRANIVISHLTDWQMISRQLHAAYHRALVSANIEITPEMVRLQDRLNRELTLDEITADDDAEEPT